MKKHVTKIVLGLLCLTTIFSCGLLESIGGSLPECSFSCNDISEKLLDHRRNKLGEEKPKAIELQDIFLSRNRCSKVTRETLNEMRESGIFKLTPNDDNTNVTFTLDDVSSYICHVHGQFELLRDPESEYYNVYYSKYNCNDLGVRIYFGAKKTPEGMLTTVFLVPVVEVDIDANGPIYEDIRQIAPLNFGHSRRPPKLYEGYIE